MPGFELANVLLFAILVITAVAAARIRHLFAVAMLSGLFSLTSASLFVLQDAVDVAFTEASVGAGISTVLFLGAIALTRARETETPPRRVLPALLVSLFAGAALLYASLDLPAFGRADTPVQLHPLTKRYLEGSIPDTGVPNVVTSVLASYRGYDTLGETAVIFTAAVGVLILLGRTRAKRRPRAG